MSGGLGSRTTAPLRFYLGTHHASQKWFDLNVPLFVSTRTLRGRKSFPTPETWWALDSGGFTELNLYGRYETTAQQYVQEIDRYIEGGMSHLAFVSPQDWMCEPFVLAKTGLSVEEHQRRTILNFEELLYALGDIVIPVLQGWTLDDYHRHWEMYDRMHIPLEKWPLVGLGSVCRRQNTAEAGRIVRSLAPLRLHYYGAKMTGLESFGDALVSADSMAWSYRARHSLPLRGCAHKSCANCVRFAARWRSELMLRLGQQRLEVAAA